MRKAWMLIVCGALLPLLASAVSYPAQTVRYKVSYRLGFINKTAGSGTVVTSCTPSGVFTGHLYGHSIPWGGRIYSVRDTLSACMTPAAPGELAVERVVCRNGVYFKPAVDGNHAYDPADPSTFWSTAGHGTLDASAGTKEAVSITADMLSFFYYAKAIDFPRMEEGRRIVVPISGDGVQGSLSVTYGGEQTVNIGEREIDTYAVVFNYTYHGVPSAYPVHCWISRQGRIPLIFSADLAIGHLEMTAIL